MRIRLLLAGALLAFLAVLGGSPAAYAQEEPAAEEEHELSPDTEECIHLAEEADDPEACQEAPSPILPATNELIWGAISFTVLLFLLWKFAWPGIKQSMETRAERIRASLEEAEHAKSEAERVLDEYRSKLDDAKSEAGRIIEESRQTADALRRDLQSRAETEIAELRRRATADVEAAKAQAIADLRDEVARIAIGAAELIIQRNLDADTQIQLIEQYINQVGAQGGR